MDISQMLFKWQPYLFIHHQPTTQIHNRFFFLCVHQLENRGAELASGTLVHLSNFTAASSGLQALLILAFILNCVGGKKINSSINRDYDLRFPITN